MYVWDKILLGSLLVLNMQTALTLPTSGGIKGMSSPLTMREDVPTLDMREELRIVLIFPSVRQK